MSTNVMPIGTAAVVFRVQTNVPGMREQKERGGVLSGTLVP